MVEKRFNIFTLEDYKNIISRIRHLIETNQENEIVNEFGYYTDDVFKKSGDFLDIKKTSSDSLDIIHITSNYSNKDAYLSLNGDVEKYKTSLSYLVRNDNYDIFSVGEFSSLENLIMQLNKEYEALVFFDNLFNSIEQIYKQSDEKLVKLCKLNEKYSVLINTDYFFENFDLFLGAYLEPKSRFIKVQNTRKIINDLLDIIS